MSKHVAFLSVAAALLGAAAAPGAAAAADYYDGVDRPLAFHGRDDADVDGGRARFERRQDLRPAYGDRRAPGPVVFDERDVERDPGRRLDGRRFGGGEPAYGRPVERPISGYDRPADGYDRPVAFVPRVAPPVWGAGGRLGDGDRPAPLYRAAAVPAGPAFDEGYGGPDVGCTIEQAQSTTPAGWRKIVTHRTCYRR